MIWFAIGYVVLVTECMICLRACHLSPHGVRCTWRGLWRQLNYRKPCLPTAVARGTTNLDNTARAPDDASRV